MRLASQRVTRSMLVRVPVGLLLPCVLLLSCERERRRFVEDDQHETLISAYPTSTLYPGVESPPAVRARIEASASGLQTRSEYQHNAWAVSQGKRLYTWFNCKECHANGGGGMGPALMDDVWTYGSDLNSIAHSIAQGRPNGMPSFREKISVAQTLQLAAYVRSLGGLVPMDVAPGRNDSMSMKNPEAMEPGQHEYQGGAPP